MKKRYFRDETFWPGFFEKKCKAAFPELIQKDSYGEYITEEDFNNNYDRYKKEYYNDFTVMFLKD
jgi:predicted N-acyltransferase